MISEERRWPETYKQAHTTDLKKIKEAKRKGKPASSNMPTVEKVYQRGLALPTEVWTQAVIVRELGIELAEAYEREYAPLLEESHKRVLSLEERSRQLERELNDARHFHHSHIEKLRAVTQRAQRYAGELEALEHQGPDINRLGLFGPTPPPMSGPDSR